MRISLLLNNLQGGGGERAHVMLANALAARGHDVELIVVKAEGECHALVSPQVRLVDLGAGRAVKALPRLVSHLRRTRPEVLVSAIVISNVLAAAASVFVPDVPMVGIEHGDMNEAYHTDRDQVAARIGYLAAPRLYPRLKRIFCVDKSTQLTVAAFTRRLDLKLSIMPNAVIGPEVDARMRGPTDHPWTGGETPLFVNVGRMADQKNQSLLLRAFAEFRKTREARLIILGDGPLRSALEAERTALGLDGSVDMPGFRDPFPLLAAADAFVLSSRWEALPTVIVEALYCGCRVVTTKASMGTLELVGYGRYGRIVDEHTPEALSSAMHDGLSDSVDSEILRMQGGRFRLDSVAALYEAELGRVVRETKTSA